jgi:hypothetical protein
VLGFPLATVALLGDNLKAFPRLFRTGGGTIRRSPAQAEKRAGEQRGELDQIHLRPGDHRCVIASGRLTA